MKKQIFLSFVLVLGWMSTSHAGVQVEHWTAPSGARVYFVESHMLPIVDVQVDVAAGDAYAPSSKAGLASLTRSLMVKGAGGLGEEQISDQLVDLGARLDGSTDTDRASFSLRTLADASKRNAALALLRKILQSPDFPAGPWEREQARSVASIREANTQPDSIAMRRFLAEAYPRHPYGQSATVESVSAITRDDLARFYQEHYDAGRAVVSIVGDLSRQEAESIAQQLTDGLPAASTVASIPEVGLPEHAVIKLQHPATQAHVYMGLPAVRRGDPDYFPLLVGNYVLGGGGFVSRLTTEVREKRGFAYSVYSYFMPLQRQGVFQIGLQTKREQASEALKVVEQTLTQFLKDGPSAEELRAAKRNLIDGFGLRIDSNREILGYLAMIGFYDLPTTYLDDFTKSVDKVSVTEIRNAFRRHVLPEHLVTVIVAGD